MDSASPLSTARPFALQLLALFGSFVGGIGVGELLARQLVPGSEAAEIVSFLLLPAAMVLGFHAWLGLALVTLVTRLVWRLARGGLAAVRAAAPAPGEPFVPPGSFAFVPVAAAMMGAGGLVCGLLPGATGFLEVFLSYLAAGAAYGFALWQLARNGYLPFLEPS